MTSLTRREWLRAAAGTGAALIAVPVLGWAAQEQGETYPFELPKLPYPYDALEPHIDARTMEIHHTKHHQGYVNNLNKALAKHPELQKMTLTQLLTGLDKLPKDVQTAVRNNGGGHYNHSLFWQIMSKNGGQPKGALAKALEGLGGTDGFRKALKEAGLGRFGSGWAWLVAGGDGALKIISTPNQDTPLPEGLTPVLGVDVWEHAYYLKYQNRRGDYIDAWFNVIDWDAVAQRYEQIRKQG